MSENNNKPETHAFELTPHIITSLDLSRTIREAENLDDQLHQAGIRSPGSSVSLPKTTRALESIAEDNGFSLLNAAHRKRLISSLQDVKLKAKKVHISFAVEPQPSVIQKIVAWFRANVDKDMIIDVGVQPTISVGCIIRTQNKVFDMSLRHRFDTSRGILAELLEETK